MSRPAVTRDVSSSLSPPLDEDELWQLNLRSTEGMDSGPYPVREGEPDCSYYIRTGLCRFGATCRFNHPPNRNLGAAPSPARGVALLTLTRGASTWTPLEAQPLGPRKAPSFWERDVIDSNGRTLQTHIQAIATAKMRGEYPERAGQPECQYYLKTGTCKFGAKCKFHHPRDQAGVAGRVSLNVLGYPLRPNESECSYYLRTGQCKFGNTCKFHHPQPSNMMVPFNGSLVYPTVQSPTSPSQQSYPGGITNWSLPSASFVPSPRWQAPSNYAQMILSQGVVSVPGWNAYRGSMGLSSSESQQQPTTTNQIYGTLRQNETANEPLTAAYSSYYALPRESVFPERPDQPDCQFYVKTGDCKFGAVCKFHHPRERLIPMPDCVLSPIGLPLRTGETTCIFYSRYGICKFGPSCKFDHPMGIFTYNFSPTSADHHLLASSSGIITSQGPIEGVSVNSRTITLMPSSDNNIDPKE